MGKLGHAWVCAWVYGGGSVGGGVLAWPSLPVAPDPNPIPAVGYAMRLHHTAATEKRFYIN